MNVSKRIVLYPSDRKKLIERIATISTVEKRTNEQVKPLREIPGPLSLPVIGQLLHFLPGGWLHKRTVELQELLYKNYGPIVRIDANFGFPPIIFIFDAEAGFNLCRKEDPLPVRPGFGSLYYYRKYYSNKKNENPTGLILDHGESWKKFRSLVNPVMLQPKTIKLYGNIMTEVADDMVKRMKLIRNEKNMLEGDLYREMILWALESVVVVSLGGRLNCLDPNLPENSATQELINTFHDVIMTLEELDFQRSLWKYIVTPGFRKGMKIYHKSMKLNEYFIDKAIDQLKANGDTNNQGKSILEKLLQIDRDVALVMANDILLAGVDTTANTTLGVLYFLAINPDKQDKLRDEIMSKEENTSYIKACIKESLRLFPIVKGTFRQTTKEHDILGYRIPKDTYVIVGNQNLCMMEEYFPRPTEFIPERWIVDKSDPLYHGNAHRFAYAPFGMGARSCIGRRIAELELESFVAKIVENFQIEWFGPPPRIKRISVINYFLGPYNFIFKDV